MTHLLRAEYHFGGGHQGTKILYLLQDEVPKTKREVDDFLEDLAFADPDLRHTSQWRGEVTVVAALPSHVRENALRTITSRIGGLQAKAALLAMVPVEEREEKRAEVVL